MEVGKSSCENMEDVLDDRSCRARHNADGLGDVGKRFFKLPVKPSFGFQFRFEFMELEEKFSHAGVLQVADDDLVITSGSINRELASDDDLVAIFERTC